MKKLIFTCLLGLSSLTIFAQKIEVSGVVSDDKGNPIPYAFIKDAQHNYATYSDQSGGFFFKVDAVDRLIVSALNFKSLVVKISSPREIKIALVADGTTTVRSIDPATFQEKLSTEGMTKNAATGYIAHEGSLHGSRYFLDHWVHGYAITMNDSIKQNDNYLYNYQKMDGSLIFTDDGKSMKEIDRNLIKMFRLFDDQGTYTFENVPAIDPKHFVQVVSANSKYKIYKQLETTFYPNDYVSNGMTSTGHNYDEIKDNPVYYVVKQSGGAPQKLALKSKALKTIFAEDGAKVSKYLSDNDGEIDDNYLIGLVEYLDR